MKHYSLLYLVVIWALCCITPMLNGMAYASTVTLTFDDIPQGQDLRYYEERYNIGFGPGFAISSGESPHSGTNVLRVIEDPQLGYTFMGFKTVNDPSGPQPVYASSIGGYFSTEPGAMLEVIGYDRWNPLVSTVIGATGQAWTNVYAQISYPAGVNFVEFRPLTEDALLHFCADDITVALIPEPSSLLALFGGLAGIGGAALRRRR